MTSLAVDHDRIDGDGLPHRVGGIPKLPKALRLKNRRSVNGCSLKTEENLTAAKSIDLEWIMFETGEVVTSLTSGTFSNNLCRRAMVLYDIYSSI